jgi:hypothetical protein
MPEDNTAQVQQLIDKASGTLTMPPGRYNIDALVSLKMKSNFILRLADGAELAALPNDQDDSAVIKAWGCDTWQILGPGKIIGDRDIHTGTRGEHGHGIDVRQSSGYRVSEGLVVTKCWGDGIILGNGTNKNGEISGVTSIGNRRQGLSVIDVDGLKVTGNHFQDTKGTAPSCGIDVECDTDAQCAKNITIDNNFFSGNDGSNIGIGGPHGQYSNIVVGPNNTFDFHTQPIWVSGNAGKLGEPWWAHLLSALKGVSWYRWWGYPTQWRSAT